MKETSLTKPGARAFVDAKVKKTKRLAKTVQSTKTYEALLHRALRIRSAVIAAVSNKEYHRLQPPLGLVATLPPSPNLLKEAGIGHLLADRRFWELGGPAAFGAFTPCRAQVEAGLSSRALHCADPA